MNRNSCKGHRNKTLVTAITAVLALGAAGGAAAEMPTAQSIFTLTPGHAPALVPSLWTQSTSLEGYLDGIDNHQYLTSDVAADVTSGNILVSGDMSGAPITNSGNALLAATKDINTGLAGANGAANTVDLLSLGSDGLNEGLGIISGQLFDGARVQSTINDGRITTDLTNYAAGSITQTDNSIKATTAINSASNQASGDLPDSFNGTTPGSVEYKFSATAPTTLTAAGSVSVGNIQTAVDAGAGAQSYAHIAGSGISVDDTMAPVIPPPLPGLIPLAVDVTANGNAIAASYAGNQSDNRFGATTGTSFTGSVSVINGQTNIETRAFDAGDTASVTGSGIGASLGGALNGALSVSDNSLSAATQGNIATNAIGFATGIDVHGGSASAHLTEQANTRATLSGDLVLLNTQRNQNTELVSRIGDGSSILGMGLHLNDGSAMTMDGNGIDASVGGNHATNQVSADSAAFSANSAVGNQQVNQGTTISAEVSGAMIVAGVLGNTSDGFDGLTDISKGNVSVSDNHIGADANGNQANTTIDLQGTNFTAWDTVDNMSASSGSTGLVTTGTAGVAVGNEQSNIGGTSIIADVGSDTDTFGTHGGWIGAFYNGGLDGASATVNDDVVSASAGGNSAVTSVMLGGTNGHVNAQMSNAQYNDNSISAQVEGAQVGVYPGGGSASGSTLTVGDNQLSAAASANQAINSVATDFTNEGFGISSQNNWNTASNVIDADAETNTNKAELAIASNQKNTGSVTARMTNSFTGVNVGEHPWPGVDGGDPLRGNVTGGTIGVSGNSASTSVVANNAGNNLGVNGGNLTPDSGHSDQVASLGNLQQNAGNVTADASAMGDDVRDLEQIGAFIHGNASGTNATVSNNGISAFVGGNVANNALTFAGTSYAPPAPTAPVGSIGYMSLDDLTVSAGFALQNVQSNNGFNEATLENGNIGVSLTDGAPDDRHAVTDSMLTISNNTVSTDARDNYATNALGIGVSYASDGTATANQLSVLNTTAALQSAQQSTGTVASSANSLLGIIAGHYDVSGSTVTVSNNSVASKAVANTAMNRLDVAAGQLTGDSLADGGAFPFRGAAASPGNSVLADYGLSNGQSHAGTVVASLDSPDASNGTGIGLAVGEGKLDGGSVTVSDNTQSAFAQANSASNTLNLLGNQIDASAAISNRQEASGTAVASAGNVTVPGHEGTLGFAVQVNGAIGSAAALPITVSGNTLVAQAGFNDATNVLHVTGENAIGGNVGEAGAFSLGGYAAAGAYDSLLNMQEADGAAVASIEPGLSGIEAVGMNANGTSSDIGNDGDVSNLTVNGNQFAAQVSLNNASNNVVLDGAANIGATAAVASQQFATGSSSAAVNSADIGIYNRNAGQLQGGAITRAAMTVSDNNLSASASGNSASNAISAQPKALNAAAATSTEAGTGTDGAAAVAKYAVLNVQGNSAVVSAALGDSSIGINADAGTVAARGSASQMLNSTANVSGNQVMASAMGNSASNSIMLTSMTGTPSASLVSSQVNTAAINATVSNVQIGVVMGGLPGLSNSPVTIANNSIAASAVGNSAVNHIGIGN